MTSSSRQLSAKRASKKVARDAKQARQRQRVDAVLENIDLKEQIAVLRAWVINSGLCLCQSPVDDPGPHLETCPWGDERYAEDACACGVQKRGPRGICETCAGEIAFEPRIVR